MGSYMKYLHKYEIIFVVHTVVYLQWGLVGHVLH